LRTWD